MEEKQRAVTEKKKGLVLAVNGQRFQVETVDPSMTLLEFLRTQTPFKSVKLGCGEGTVLFLMYPEKDLSCIVHRFDL